MDTFLFVLRVLCVVIASLTALIYGLFQLYQKIPSTAFRITTADIIVYAVVGLVFGFATNSYYGLGAWLPLLLVKYFCRQWIPSQRRGWGLWMEVDWRFLPPRGFEHFQQHRTLLSEMNKMPKSTHFVLPRVYALVFLYFMGKKMGKDSKSLPQGISTSQANFAMQEFSQLIQRIKKLKNKGTEKKEFPFGVLKVTRM